MLDDPLIHIWGLSVLAYALMPKSILFPQYHMPLEFMQYRISLFIAVLLCAVVSGGAHGRSLTRVSGLLASVFFTLMYLDARSLNRVEADLAGMLSNLPPSSRVAAALLDSASWRLNGLEHAGAPLASGAASIMGTMSRRARHSGSAFPAPTAWSRAIWIRQAR